MANADGSAAAAIIGTFSPAMAVMVTRRALPEVPFMAKFRAAIIPVTLFQQNCTLLWSEESKRGAVIDPGGDLDDIAAAIDETGIAVEKILLTHGHIDHAGGAAELKEKLGVPIEGPHRADAPLLDHLAETGRAYGIEARAVTPDRWLDEGDEVTVGDLAFSILHCPGHSPGSVVFVNASERFAIVGDVLFRGSVGRTDLPGGNHDALIHAIKTKLLPLGDDIAFICGHGPASTIGQERATNPFLR
jgi:glyoxylase-like metal-dependent hydrolase (beta-lactamase superfamily II)